jgi:hypothetical protein
LSQNFPDTSALAQQLKILSKPLYAVPENAGIGNMFNCMFMQLDASANPNFFTNLESNFYAQAAGPYEMVNPNSVLGSSKSEDEYKFTFLQFHYHMKSKHFALHYELEKIVKETMARIDVAYALRTSYIFNAEKQAHKLAIKRQNLPQDEFLSFDPEIVTLLDKSDRTELFFLAYAQGILKFIDEDEFNHTQWILDLSDGSDKIILYDQNEKQMEDSDKCTVYEAIRYWLVGNDCRPNNPNKVDWNQLRKLIRKNETSSKELIIGNYKTQLDEENIGNIISLINRQLQSPLDHDKGLIFPGHIRGRRSEVYNDLKDLAKIFLRERIKLLSLENFEW